MKKKANIVQQDTEKMLDIVVSIYPEGDRAYMKHLMATRLAEHYGERWKDREHCINCGALMRAYTYTINRTAARAMIKLGEAVRERVYEGKPFTEANQLYMSGMHSRLTATETDQKTILRYHGLLAKVKKDGRHKDHLWAITRRGWAFLRGERVQKSVTVWRSEITERSEETTTIIEALQDSGTIEHNRYYDFVPHEGTLV